MKRKTLALVKAIIILPGNAVIVIPGLLLYIEGDFRGGLERNIFNIKGKFHGGSQSSGLTGNSINFTAKQSIVI